MTKPTMQEMFNRAWNGLKAQGWVRSMREPGGVNQVGALCLYAGPDGRRCAWGHVDPSLTELHNQQGDVGALHRKECGLASVLSGPELEFARRLQKAHDVATGPADMVSLLRQVADMYKLAVPE